MFGIDVDYVRRKATELSRKLTEQEGKGTGREKHRARPRKYFDRRVDRGTGRHGGKSERKCDFEIVKLKNLHTKRNEAKNELIKAIDNSKKSCE